MGDVWRARDTRLERDVAIKVLPETLAKDEQFRQRFEREARTVSQLNHPHICTLHDVGEEDGRHYLVLELLEGESLADRLARGPLPLHEVLRFGSQVAKALDAAHRSGITHRDLKPGNVMLTKSGAKLLDFGLAKGGSDAPAVVSNLTSLPTEARPLTEQGTILGTFQYMAPEQLEGEAADARTDIFALGALLYEMATGQRAFQGANKTTLIAAIVSSQPSPVSSVLATTPPALDHVIRRCLEKDPEDRWQSAQDVASELHWIGEAGSQAGSPVAVTLKRKTRERLAWATAAIGLLAAVGASIALWATREPPREVMRFPVLLPEGQSLVFDAFPAVALSPDGRRQIAVVAGEDGRPQLAIKQIDQLDARLLPGTEHARAPFFSPDAEWVAFFTESGLYKIAVAGGPPVVVASGTFGQTRGGAWLADGTIVFTPRAAGGLQRVPENGGEAEVLTTPDAARSERTHRWPAALPGGRAILFTSDTTESTEYYDDARIEAVSIATGERKVVIEQSSRAEYLSTGHLVFARGGSLFAVPFDAEQLEVRGSTALVLQEVATDVASGAAHFSVSSEGSVLYVRGDVASSFNQPVRVDREGNEEDLGVPPGRHFGLSLAPDERRLALVEGGGAGTDVWVADLERGTFSRLTFENTATEPVWSPDGTRIAYAALPPQTSRFDVFRRPADGSGAAEVLWSDAASISPPGVLRRRHAVGGGSRGGTRRGLGPVDPPTGR